MLNLKVGQKVVWHSRDILADSYYLATVSNVEKDFALARLDEDVNEVLWIDKDTEEDFSLDLSLAS